MRVCDVCDSENESTKIVCIDCHNANLDEYERVMKQRDALLAAISWIKDECVRLDYESNGTKYIEAIERIGVFCAETIAVSKGGR